MAEQITEIAANDLTAMQREINRGLMVQFINADLVERAALDVRSSIVFYDEDKMFSYAVGALPDQQTLQRLAQSTGLRYWSHGC